MNCEICYWPLDEPLGKPVPHRKTACLANMVCDRADARKIVKAARALIGKNVTRPEIYKDQDTAKYNLALALQEADKDKGAPFTLEP